MAKYDPNSSGPRIKREKTQLSKEENAARQQALRLNATSESGRPETILATGEKLSYGGGLASGFNPDPRVTGWQYNPNALGADTFNPNSWVAAQPTTADPELANVFAKPMPQGRFVDPTVPSPLSAARMSQLNDLKNDPEGFTAAGKKYIEDQAASLNQEQSLVDKGKSMLARIFDYQDEADLSLFGVPMGAVESVWDRSLRHVIGAYDLLSVGFGGLLSAAPGGVRTLSYEELSAGKSVLEILNGEMEPGSAPSPGQIFVASGAADAARMRDMMNSGEITLPVALAINPMAVFGLMAEDSPLQQGDPDNIADDVLLDQAKRESAFGSGWEQWMSGITDFGLMFADPAIGAGVALKVAKAGALGSKMPAKLALQTQAATRAGVAEVLQHHTQQAFDMDSLDNLINDAAASTNPTKTTEPMIEALLNGKPLPETRPVPAQRIYSDMSPTTPYKNTMAQLLDEVSVFDRATDQKVLSYDDILNRPEIRNNPQGPQLAAALYESRDVVEAALIIDSFHGSPNGLKRLAALAPAAADEILRLRMHQLSALRHTTEPQKIKDAINGLDSTISAFEQQLDNLKDFAGKKAGDSTEFDANITRRIETLQVSIDEAKALKALIKDEKIPDVLDYNNPKFDPDVADQIIADLHNRQDVVTLALNSNIADAALAGRFQFVVKDNWYARAVSKSRSRRAKAASEYAAEGVTIPGLRKIERVNQQTGEITYGRDWGFSEFTPGIAGMVKRQARVWRWLGQETPSGYIGLKGTSTVGSEREFNAALSNLDMYQGAAIVIDVVDESGKVTQRAVGGIEARQRYLREFLSGLNDPSVDSLEVLKKIEARIAQDYADVYFPNAKDGREAVLEVARRGDRSRDSLLSEIRRRGYFVDPEDGKLHYAPYLKSQLANGTYMQNWGAIEKGLKHQVKGRKHQVVGQSIDVAIDYVQMADDLFQRFWRPATLLRFGYTQRNVFEGMLRAMAYQASLAPLLWPVRGTFDGAKNVVRTRVAKKKVAQAEKAIAESDFAPVYQELTDAAMEHHRLTAAMQLTDEATGEKMWHVFERSVDGETARRVLNDDEFAAARKAASDRMDAAEEALVANKEKFDAAVENTAFGDWRRIQIKDLETEIANNQAAFNLLNDIASESGDFSDLNRMLADIGGNADRIGELAAMKVVLQKQLDDLTYRPNFAMQMYREVSGRQRRIGSGTSIGPDGSYYNDAFNGPLANMNRGLMSADNTVKQSYSLRSDVFNNVFQRMFVRENRPIPFDHLNANKRERWYEGMASVLEDASSNAIIYQLIKNNWDVDAVLRWMQTTENGQEYTGQLMKLFGHNADVDPVLMSIDAQEGRKLLKDEIAAAERQVYETVESKNMFGEGTGQEAYRLKSFVREEVDEAGRPVFVFDAEQAAAYVSDVSNKVRQQLQDVPEFYRLLEARAELKGTERASQFIDAPRIRQIVENMTPEQRATLGYVQGSEVIQMGTARFMDVYTSIVNKAFKALGTIPEDAIVRGPFYNKRYVDIRNDLIRSYWIRQGTTAEEVALLRRESPALVEQRIKEILGKYESDKTLVDSAGRLMPDKIAHEAFKIPSKELHRIETLAHRAALRDTKEWMYTIDRRTKLGKYGEFIFPFISASQNSAVVAGKLINKEPWLVPFVVDLWRAPTRLGIEDEEGNISFPVPEPMVDFLNSLPMTEGVLEKGQMLSMPKDGLNVAFPDSGFGPLPRPAVMVQVGASELMKIGAFPVETPEVFKALFPGDGADDAYAALKDYIFGEQGTLSDKAASWDKIIPASWQRIIEMKDELSAEYGYESQLIYHSEMAKYRAGDRDTRPDPAEIHKKTTNSFWMKFFGNLGVPVLSGVAGPVLTRPNVERPEVQELQNLYRDFLAVDPANANLNFYNMFGEVGLEMALTKVSQANAGADPTMNTVTDIRRYDNALRTASAALTEEDYDLLGILVNNRNDPDAAYDESAYAWQKAHNVPGTNVKFREVQSPEQAIADRQRIVGWTIYRSAMDQLDANLAARGLKSYQAKDASDLLNAKNVLIANMANNPDLAGWWVDFSDAGGKRTNGAIRVMEVGLSDETFRRGMLESGKELTLAAMENYVYYRRGIIDAVKASGLPMSDPANGWIMESWSNIRQQLKMSDIRFSEIFDIYLSNDENPTYPGNYIVDPAALAYVGGDYVGAR